MDFDSVCINGLLYRLGQSEIDGKLWRILKQMYSDFSCCLQLDRIQSQWFKIHQGLHQGIEYENFINPLLVALRSPGYGVIVNDIPVSSPTFTDDIAIICLHKKCLQFQLDIANEFIGKNWKLSFNATKNIIVSYGAKTRSRNGYYASQ